MNECRKWGCNSIMGQAVSKKMNWAAGAGWA